MEENHFNEIIGLVRRRKFEEADKIIKEGFDINQKGFEDTTILMICADLDLSSVKFLVENNASIDATDIRGDTALHFASSYHHNFTLEVVQYLINKGAKVNARNKEGHTPLYQAVTYVGRPQLIELLQKNGADPEISPDENLTMLHYCHHSIISKTLLENGANPNGKKGGTTPLMKEIIHKNLEACRALIRFGADVNLFSDGLSPLHRACTHYEIEIAELLVENGADIEAKEIFGITPFLFACKLEQPTIMSYLKKKGANIHAVAQNQNCLSIFCIHGDIINFKIYTEEKVKCIENQAKENNLHLLCKTKSKKGKQRSRVHIFTLLFYQGIDINQRNMSGETPIMNAFEAGNNKLVKILIPISDLSLKDKKGNTIRYYIKKEGKSEKFSGSFKRRDVLTVLLIGRFRDKENNLAKLPKDIFMYILYLSDAWIKPKFLRYKN